MGILERLRKSWDVFSSRESRDNFDPGYGTMVSYNHSPNRIRRVTVSERSLLSSVYTRISNDCASINIKHVRLTENNQLSEVMTSELNSCLNVSANLDQTGYAFRYDIFATLLDNGVIAIVPVIVSKDPNNTGSFDIYELRVGTVTAWYPKHVQVEVYNENSGLKETLVLPKEYVALVENPFYSVMNEPNSTYQRLVRKLNMLDVIDEQTSSGKLDIIIQLPYTIKNETRKEQARQRGENIEMQLKNSKYGIAYIDSTERITQLNRPAENNLLKQVEYLTTMLYSQLGITEEILNGTANEVVMTNYKNRTIRPLVNAVTEAMERSFLTKTARTQKQAIRFYIDPFELMPAAQFADVADKLTRNEIMSSNEVRSMLGLMPSDDPRADELINKNMPREEIEEEVVTKLESEEA